MREYAREYGGAHGWMMNIFSLSCRCANMRANMEVLMARGVDGEY